MKTNFLTRNWKPATATLLAFAIGATTMAQFGGGVGQLIKGGGVIVLVKNLGPKMNAQLNQLAHTPDVPPNSVTKVVPILSGGLNSRKAVGAAQVRGPRHAVDKVNAVAQLNQDFMGTMKMTVYIPITSKDVIKDLKPVPGVGVTGVVDIKLNL